MALVLAFNPPQPVSNKYWHKQTGSVRNILAIVYVPSILFFLMLLINRVEDLLQFNQVLNRLFFFNIRKILRMQTH